MGATERELYDIAVPAKVNTSIVGDTPLSLKVETHDAMSEEAESEPGGDGAGQFVDCEKLLDPTGQRDDVGIAGGRLRHPRQLDFKLK